MKRIVSFALALAMLLSCFVSCGEDPCSHSDTDNNGFCDNCSEAVPQEKMDYTVSVTDGKGSPVSGVIVKVFGEDDTVMDEPLVMKATRSEGTVNFNLPIKNYKIRLYNTKNEELQYDKDSAVISEVYPDLTLKIYDKLTETIESMYGDLYRVGVGSYLIDFESDFLSYFVFIPERTGVYKISVIADTQVEVGNYGNPLNILGSDITDAADRINNYSFKITVNSTNMGGFDEKATNYTVGVKGRVRAGSGALVVERIADVQTIPSSVVQPPKDLPMSDYRGGMPEEIDITVSGFSKKYAAVYNENDGYYHLCLNHNASDANHECNENGPVIYVRLASNDAPINFKEMINAGNGISCYLYDALGNALERKDYTAMMQAYIEAADPTYGVYALTEGLREAIQNYGEYVGWFEHGGQNYLFGDKIVLSNYKGSEFLAFCCFA